MGCHKYKPLIKKEKADKVKKCTQEDFKVFVNGVFNVKSIPIGYNYLLGYCEQPNCDKNQY